MSTSRTSSTTSSNSFTIDEGKQVETKGVGHKSLIVPSNPAMASKCVPPDITQDERIRKIEETISQITCFQESFQVAFMDRKKNFAYEMKELTEEIEALFKKMESLKQYLEAELEEHKQAIDSYQLKNEDQLMSIKETLKHMQNLVECSSSNAHSKTLQDLQQEITQLKAAFVKVANSETERMQNAAEQWRMVAELKTENKKIRELLELTREDMTAKGLEIQQLKLSHEKMHSEMEDLTKELERLNGKPGQYSSLAFLDQMIQSTKFTSPSAEKKTKVTLRRTKSNIVKRINN